MANKLAFVGIARTHPTLTRYGYEYEKFPTFSIEYEDVHIPVIILVPAISPSPFKLLKYLQLIK